MYPSSRQVLFGARQNALNCLQRLGVSLPRRLLLSCVSAAFVVSVVGAPLDSLAGGLAPVPKALTPRIAWTHLRYQGENLLGKLTATLTVKPLPHDAVNETEATARAGGVQTAMQLALDTRIEPRFLPRRRSEIGVWFRPADGAVLRHVKTHFGSEPYRKSYRFSAGGVHRERRNPSDDREVELPPEEWTRVRQAFYGLSDHGCTVISDPAAMLYLASARGFFSENAVRKYCVFYSKHFYQVELRETGFKRTAVDYRALSAHQHGRAQGFVETARVTIKAQPLDASDPDLQSTEYEVLLDKALRFPLRVHGVVAGLGEVTLTLEQVQLRDGLKLSPLTQ